MVLAFVQEVFRTHTMDGTSNIVVNDPLAKGKKKTRNGLIFGFNNEIVNNYSGYNASRCDGRGCNRSGRGRRQQV